MTEEEIAGWVARQLAIAPERDDSWGERILATYLGEDPQVPTVAA